MKTEIKRRTFLQTAGASTGIGFIDSKAALSSVFKTESLSLMPAKTWIATAFNKADEALFGEIRGSHNSGFNDFWNKYFNWTSEQSAPHPDQVLKELRHICMNIFMRLGKYSEHMQILRENISKVKSFMKEIEPVYNLHFFHKDRDHSHLVIQCMENFINDVTLTPAEKLAMLEKQYKNTFPSPFALCPVNWKREPAEVLQELKAQIAKWKKTIRSAEFSAEKQSIWPEDEHNAIASFNSFVFAHNREKFRHMYLLQDEKWNKLNEHFGFTEDAYWDVVAELDWRTDWGIGTLDPKPFTINIDQDAHQLVNHVSKYVQGLSLRFSKERWPENDHRRVDNRNREIYIEICNRIEEETAKWLPDLIKRFFPTVWQELLQGRHPELREKLQSKTTGRIYDEDLNKLDNKEYLDYAWTQIHKGNDYY